MTHWLTTHWHTFLFALQRMLHAPTASLLTAAVIGITLSLPAGLYTLLQNVDAVTPNMQAEPQISLFLTLTATKTDVQKIDSLLHKNPAIRSASRRSGRKASWPI